LQRDRRDRLAGGALDHLQHARLARRHEQDRDAFAAGTAGAADAVHIGFGVVGDVVVDDVRHARHVDAAGGDVGGDDDVERAVLELLDDALAQTLGHVAIEGGRSVAARGELVGEFLGGALGAHEHDGGVEALLGVEDAGERIELVHPAHQPVTLADLGHGRSGGADLDLLRLAQVAAGDVADDVRHRRREQRGLALGRRVLEDPLDVVDEAHAQHLVGLVEHDRLERIELQAFAFEMVHDPPRGADDDLGAARQLAQLHHHALPAVDRQHVEVPEVVGVLGEGLGDLDRQFARRGEHEHLRSRVGEIDARQHRQRERGSLAGTGLGLAEDVAACEQLRNAGGLNGRRRFIADLGQRRKERGREVEVGEAQGSLGAGGFGAGRVGHGSRAVVAAMCSSAAKSRLSAIPARQTKKAARGRRGANQAGVSSGRRRKSKNAAQGRVSDQSKDVGDVGSITAGGCWPPAGPSGRS